MDLKLCRICGEREGVSYIFSETDAIPLSAKIMYCCSKVVVSKEDGLPESICRSCEHELAAAHRFAAKCEATDLMFRGLMPLIKYEFLVPETDSCAPKVEVKEEDDWQSNHHELSTASPPPPFNPTTPKVQRKKRSHRKRHKYKPTTKCSVCGRNCVSPSALVIHMRYHTGESPYCCPNCDKKYKDQGSLKRHMDRNHGQRERKFICETCGKGFFTKSDITIHMRTHTGETPYVCTECPRRFTQISALLRHQRIHTGEKPYQCSTCPKQFSTKDQVKHHQTAHSAEKNFSCPICKTTFKYKNNLQKHIGVHKYPNNFVCNHCGRTFNQKGNLKIHINRSHSEKSGFCKVCGKSVSNYEVHMWRHTGHRPLKCEACARSFFDSKSLAKHVNYRHKRPDKYQCSYEGCSMKFPSRPMLEFHTAKQHEHSFPFPCDRCARGFYRKSDLARHKLGTHKERLNTVI